MLRAGVAADWQADIKPYQTMLAALIAENPSVAPNVDDPFIPCANGPPRRLPAS